MPNAASALAGAIAAACLARTGLPALLSEDSLRGCSFELVIVDDRPLPASARGVQSQNYWAMSALLNYAYASRWNYGFRYVQLNSSLMPQYHPTWGKVFYFAERLRAASRSSDCIWFLCLDTDAFVREYDLPLPVFLAGLGRRYRIRADIGAIFSREQDLDMGSGLRKYMRSYRPKVPWLNGGVYIVQGGKRGRLLFDTWEAAGRATSPFLKLNWPGEQAVITELITPGTYPDARFPRAAPDLGCVNCSLAAVDMVEFNSPWGRFVIHLWSHHDYLRDVAFWDALVRIRLNGPKEMATVYYKLLATSVETWGPSSAAVGPGGAGPSRSRQRTPVQDGPHQRRRP